MLLFRTWGMKPELWVHSKHMFSCRATHPAHNSSLLGLHPQPTKPCLPFAVNRIPEVFQGDVIPGSGSSVSRPHHSHVPAQNRTESALHTDILARDSDAHLCRFTQPSVLSSYVCFVCQFPFFTVTSSMIYRKEPELWSQEI